MALLLVMEVFLRCTDYLESTLSTQQNVEELQHASQNTEQYTIQTTAIHNQRSSIVTFTKMGAEFHFLLLSFGMIMMIGERKKITGSKESLDGQDGASSNEEKLREAEQSLQEANRKLEQANKELNKVKEELNDFSYSVSHDLRAPLRIISGFSSILIEEYSSNTDPNIKRVLDTIQQNTKRMEELINDLLELSRLGTMALNKHEFNMKTLIDQLIADRADEIGKIIKVHAMSSKSYGDANLLKQVWENLLSNAIKFSSRATEPHIEIGFESLASDQLFWIKDNGVGFDPTYSDKLFKVFSRLHSKKDFEGTGAGLAIARKIIDAHGGRIWAEGKPSQGATFYFTLPIS